MTDDVTVHVPRRRDRKGVMHEADSQLYTSGMVEHYARFGRTVQEVSMSDLHRWQGGDLLTPEETVHWIQRTDVFLDTKIAAVLRHLLWAQIPMTQADLMMVYGQGQYGRGDAVCAQIPVVRCTGTLGKSERKIWSWNLGSVDHYLAHMSPMHLQRAFTRLERLVVLGELDTATSRVSYREGGRTATPLRTWQERLEQLDREIKRRSHL